MGCSSFLLWPLLPQVLMEAWEKGVNPEGNSTNPSNWDFSNSFFFAGTVVTTIGEVLSFLINWGFFQLSSKAPRNVQLVERIHPHKYLDCCGLRFSTGFQLYLLFLCVKHISPAKKAECLLGTCNVIWYMHSTSWGCFEALSCTHHKIRDLYKMTLLFKSNIFHVKFSVSSSECTGFYHKRWQFVGRFNCRKS